MELVEWAHAPREDPKGYKFILSQEEAEDLQNAVAIALRYGKCDDGKSIIWLYCLLLLC